MIPEARGWDRSQRSRQDPMTGRAKAWCFPRKVKTNVTLVFGLPGLLACLAGAIRKPVLDS